MTTSRIARVVAAAGAALAVIGIGVGGWGAAHLRAQTPAASSPAAPAPQTPLFRSSRELVLVNVVVRDKNGAPVRGLTKDDFVLTEDGKPQTIDRVDAEELDGAAAPAAGGGGAAILATPAAIAPGATTPATPTAPTAGVPGAPGAPRAVDAAAMHDHRLIVLFFDLSSMQPEELARAVKAAHDYVDKTLAPADLIAVASFATSFQVVQDFTPDRALLSAALDRFGGAGSQGFDLGATADTTDTVDTGADFAADDTEFNVFSTDRRLDALQTLADQLAGIEQKKSVVYFTGGMSQNGQDNQVELRRTIDRAIRANVSIYAADMRGLQAIVPGGDATQGSGRGQGAFTGAGMRGQVDSHAASEDALSAMAEDTGGRAFFDSNSFGQVFQRVVNDTSVYYVLGYSSTNPARDGRFRKITVRLSRPDLKAEYRSGYYAGRDFAHATKDDKEQQLQDQLTSDLSATDLSVYVSTSYFRLADNRYFVPVSVVVPGNQIPAAGAAPATLDVLGLVRDAQQRPVGRIRDTVRLASGGAADLQSKTVQYQTGLELPPGTYHAKIVVRENRGGTFGSYETTVVVPDLKGDAVEVSSVVVGTSLQPSAQKAGHNPLVRDGQEIVPNVTHVVLAGQHLYFYYEVYDPAAAAGASGDASAINVLTSLTFFRGRARAFETPVVEATALTAPDRRTAVFQFDVPAASLSPGLYTCQVNVIDDAAGRFTFPRLPLYVRP